jgi:hypothetical protein
MHSIEKRLLSNVVWLGSGAVWRLLPAGMLLAQTVLAQTASDLGANRDASGVVFPNADWIRFPARPSKSAAAVTPPDSAPPASATGSTTDKPTPPRPAKAAAAASNNDWVQFPRLPPPTPKAKPTTAAPVATPSPAPDPATANTPKPADTAPPATAVKPPVTPQSETVAQPADNSDEFKFKRFRFQGNTVYSEAALRKLLAVTVPAVKDVNDLQRAAEVVANHYQDDGVLARVDLLPQDLTEGVVTMTITEGRFGGAKMETPESPKLPHDFLVKLVSC